MPRRIQRHAAQVDKLISTIRKIEGEVLIKGGTPSGAGSLPSAPHKAYMKSAEELWAEFRASRITRAQLEEELASLEKAYARRGSWDAWDES